MEEETERLKEEERCDMGEMQLLTSSPRPGETRLVGCYCVTLLYG